MGSEGSGGSAHRDTSNHLSSALADWGDPTLLEAGKCDSCLQEGLEGRSGNHRPVSLTSVPGKVMEQIILSTITQHVQDNQGIRPSQPGFVKGRSCLTNLISFYDKVTCLVDEGRAVDVSTWA
ncbi:rna-directed dna polymerase from mobile element jockey-like [Pitangus sulphuratus]|nr:rna-directed dna polymerase from mobile element jockey-like [Pitangus sulphuratus]